VSGTGTERSTRPEITTDEGDHDRFSHYVPKALLNRALVLGEPVTALCGKVWVPSRDPERYPVCPICKKIKDRRDRRGSN
jgi:Protein of unknown function (DUF3039)